MPNIQLSLNDSEHTILTAAAAKQGIPVVDYIRSRIFDEENEFTTAYAETLRRVEALPPGTKFNLKALFGTDWTMSRGTKLTLGRTFYEMVRSSAVPTVKALGKDSSNIMQYKRL